MKSLVTDNAEQYGSSEKLAARARLNSKYLIADQPWFSWVADRLPLKGGDELLDIGCGPGWFWENAVAKIPAGLALTLVDSSSGMVEEAMQRCSALLFGELKGQTADASSLPLAPESFDGAIAMHMLYHLPDPALAIAEIFRVLRPGGFLAVTTNGATNMRELYALTTAFGVMPHDPAGAVFGFSDAQRMLGEQFGNVRSHVYPARMRVTDPGDVFLALTSFSPGDRANDHQREALKKAIQAAFDEEGGALDVQKETGLFLALKNAE